MRLRQFARSDVPQDDPAPWTFSSSVELHQAPAVKTSHLHLSDPRPTHHDTTSDFLEDTTSGPVLPLPNFGSCVTDLNTGHFFTFVIGSCDLCADSAELGEQGGMSWFYRQEFDSHQGNVFLSGMDPRRGSMKRWERVFSVPT
ncbi:hypothetical protein C8J56DRAFT_881783 [Mycena floridula]|nr:hypothetical protein C8J56DRAFT_881783 [Mycena floridula]